MKTLKVYDYVHTAVKVAAAQEGRTTTYIASEIIRNHFGLPGDTQEEESESDQEPANPEGQTA